MRLSGAVNGHLALDFAFDVRHVLFVLNAIALVALVVYLVYVSLHPRRAAQEAKPPANLTPFLEDDELETRRLERVQGWAFLFAAIVAVAIPLYWLREPTRQAHSVKYFDKNAVERGATLFAAPGGAGYNSVLSLQCAGCHGDRGQGGATKTTVHGLPVVWKVPPLNTALLRFHEDPQCLNPALAPQYVCAVTDIVTYGRPNTPMQAWGTRGGGPKNDQSIADIVAYLFSIQLTPAEARAQAAKDLAAAASSDPRSGCPEYLTCPGQQLAKARSDLASAQGTLAGDRAALQKALSQPAATDPSLVGACASIESTVDAGQPLTDALRSQAKACDAYRKDSNALRAAQAALTTAQQWVTVRAGISEGQLLFEDFCARCHTAGWSSFDPAQPVGTDPTKPNYLGASGGGGGEGGGIGFNLRDQDEIRRFGDDQQGGFAAQVDFVSAGSLPFKPYGQGGIGSGRMPGFAQMLAPDQIKQIVSYERYCLESTSYTAPGAPCATGTQPRTPPTTTTTVARAGG